MTLFTFKSLFSSARVGTKLAGGALLLTVFSLSPSVWAAEQGRHDNHHRDGYKERQRDSHARRDTSRHDKHTARHDKHRNHGKRHDERHGHHGKREHYARTEPRRHDVHRRHHKHYRSNAHRHHRPPYYGSSHKHHKRYHHRGHENAAFLLGGVILGAVLSDASRASDHYYYDGFERRSFRHLHSSRCYQSYYENGRRVLVEVPRDFCRAY
ncbi:MAG TPA: hypothetical protein VIC26_01420 [Marinagarivorans sp.]